MASTSLRELAQLLEVPERTMRRAANEGLIRGRRVSPRRFETTMREEEYLRQHWPLLRDARAALRTEPNVRLGVLFGSQATGRAAPSSDVDVLVVLEDATVTKVAELTARLEDRLEREVQLVRIEDAIESPALMVDLLEHGRVLVDRGGRWDELQKQRENWTSRAAAEPTDLLAFPDLDIS